MKISRRNFVGSASCAAAGALCSFPSLALAAGDSRSTRGTHCSLLDLKSQCVLPESRDGYRLALGEDHRTLSELDLDLREVHRAIIVPAAGTVDSAMVDRLSAVLASGTAVVWECGAAFLSPTDFATHQATLQDYFAITIGQPIDLWRSTPPKRIPAHRATDQPLKSKLLGHHQVPYVTYQWPHETRVRDFSRTIPVSAKDGGAIAHLGDLPVAWRRPVGKGTLVFLGSPIGPALRAGDAEAHSWLRAVLAESV
jgi:hypothetical protein